MNCVDRIYSDLAIIERRDDALTVIGMVEGLTQEELQNKTGTRLNFADDCERLKVS